MFDFSQYVSTTPVNTKVITSHSEKVKRTESRDKHLEQDGSYHNKLTAFEQYILAQIKYCEDNIAVIRDTYIDEESLAEIQGMKAELNGLLAMHKEILAHYQSVANLIEEAKPRQEELKEKLNV